jgi:hypothetical protein
LLEHRGELGGGRGVGHGGGRYSWPQKARAGARNGCSHAGFQKRRFALKSGWVGADGRGGTHYLRMAP